MQENGPTERQKAEIPVGREGTLSAKLSKSMNALRGSAVSKLAFTFTAFLLITALKGSLLH